MRKLLALVALLFASPAFATDPQFGAIRIEATQAVTHAFVSAKTQGSDVSKVSRDEWNAAHVAPAILIASVPTGFVWPEQPAAVTEFCGGSTEYRWRANLTASSTIRLTAQVISAGAATAALRLQYTTDSSGATGWDYLDSISGPSVSINATGVTVSASVSVATAAKADVLLRLVGINGDGAGGTACYSAINAATATLATSATSATSATTASTATALAANGANCSAGNYPLGVDASGAVESCTAAASGDALTTNPLSQFAATTSAELAGVLSDETGTGKAVFSISPTFDNGAAAVPVVTFNDNGSPVLCIADGGDLWFNCGSTYKIQTTGLAYLNQVITNKVIVPSSVGAAAQGIDATNTFRLFGNTTLTPDAGVLSTKTLGNSIHVMEDADAGYDFNNGPCATSACTDPALIVHSHNQTTTQYLSLQHNAANAVITSGLGPVALSPGSAVASATALPLPTGNVFHVTGTTTITSITSTGFSAGMTITLIFDGVLTFTDGSNLKLAGDFVTTADDTISLVFDGVNFYEVARSVN